MDSRGCKSLDEFFKKEKEFDGSNKTMRQDDDSVIFEEDDSDVEGEPFL